MTHYEGYDAVVRKIDEVRARWRTTYVVEGALLALALLAGVMLLCALVEGWLPLPAGRLQTAARWLMLAALLATGLGGLALLVLKRLITDRSDEDLALQAEAAFPQTDNALINAIRLAQERVVPSPALVNEAIKESARKVEPLDMRRTVPAKRLARRAGACAALVTALVLLMILFPARMFNVFARIAQPGKAIPRIGRVVIKTLSPPGDSTLVAGETLQVSAVIEATGAEDIPGTFDYLFDGGQPKSVALHREGDGTVFRAALRDVRVPLGYQLEIGGTETPRFRVTIVERPTVTSIWRRYDFPEYAAMPPKTEEDAEGAISVLAGTMVQLKATANKPIQQATLRRQDGSEANFIVEAEKTNLTLATGFRVIENGWYTITLKDQMGNESAGGERTIRAVPDKPPTVTIAAPARDVMLPPGATLELVVRGADDYGIVRASLIAWREGSSEQEVLREWTGLSGKSCSLSWQWPLQPERYKSGEIYRYCVKMWDNNAVKGPSMGASAEYQLRIEDPAASRQRAEEKYRNWRLALQQLLDEQRRLRQEAGELGGTK